VTIVTYLRNNPFCLRTPDFPHQNARPMKRLLLFFCLFLSFISLEAQTTNIGLTATAYDENGMTFTGPSVGVTAPLGKHLALDLDLGLLHAMKMETDDFKFKYQARKLSAELRYYFLKKRSGLFLGYQMSHTSFGYKLKGDQPNFTIQVPYDDAFSSSLTLGLEARLNEKSKLGVNTFGGLILGTEQPIYGMEIYLSCNF